MGIFFAILSSIGWALSAILVGHGLRNLKPLPGAALSLISSFLTVGCLTLLLQRNELLSIPLKGILWFAVIGTFNFALGRLCHYLSIQRIGAARTTSITASAPIFASLSAIIFLGETPNLMVIAGTVLVLGGVYTTISAKR
ncbi:MAG: DMT family transporter [Dehalococcoidia bacterium]|nr:DMT family transporter [Dehalococcoidia bacterium]MDZ4246290.1 DMT family transporter [Dehalococcoidia bacterium]